MTDVYEYSTQPLHDALPISAPGAAAAAKATCPTEGRPGAAGDDRGCDTASPRRSTSGRPGPGSCGAGGSAPPPAPGADRKSTRLNSSHVSISYAVFCLK